MKTLKDYYNGNTFRKVEIVESIEALPRDYTFITCILDSKTMSRYNIYKDSNNFYYAINEDN